MRLELQKRKARDAAFADALKQLNPGYVLCEEMIAARVRSGLTQAQVAQRMGTTQSVIARLEGGQRSPSVRTLRRIAEATGSRLIMRLEHAADQWSPNREFALQENPDRY